MNSQQLGKSVFFFTTMLLASCVSVSVKTAKFTRANNVSVTPPPKPFAEFHSEHVDMAWKNAASGSSISYVSECSQQSDPTLEAVLDGLFFNLKSRKLYPRVRKTFNGRVAIQQRGSGRVDGVDTELEVLVFKREDCLFILNFVSSPTSYSQELGAFQRFIDGFEVK